MVALSTAEAELIALSVAAQGGLFLKHVLEELGGRIRLQLLADSSSARAIVQRRDVGKIKHLAIRQLWLQDLLRDGELTCGAVTSSENLADMFTKNFTAARHEWLAEALGLHRQA